MAGDSIFTGKSVDEAIAEGLRALGLRADAANIEVISRGSRGIFGLGSEPAQVRITRRASHASTPPPAAVDADDAVEESIVATSEVETAMPAAPPIAAPPIAAPPIAVTTAAGAEATLQDDEDALHDAPSTPEDDAQLAALATEFLNKLVELMGFEAEVIAEWREPDTDNEQRYLLLDLQGRDLSPLIGRRGDILGNMQYLIRLMINQRLHHWKNIVVDVEGYRQRRMEHLSQLALRSAQQVAQSGRPLSLEPMPANERRIIHLSLRDHADVFTESIGEGTRRKVQILPRK
jgi:spoIIIJ-associated protein